MASKLILLLSLLSLASFSLVTSITLPGPRPPPRGLRPPPLGWRPPPRGWRPPPRGWRPPPCYWWRPYPCGWRPPPRGGNRPPMRAPPPMMVPTPSKMTPPPRMVPTPSKMIPPPRRAPTPPPSKGICPKNTLQLGACVGLLNLLSVGINPPLNGSTRPCCNLIAGLADLEATVCLCLTIKAHLLQIVNVQTDISLALKVCNRNIPPKAIKCPK